MEWFFFIVVVWVQVDTFLVRAEIKSNRNLHAV